MNTSRQPRSRSTKQSATSSGSSAQGKKLFIVESPTKVRTIEKYLGSDYIVAATVGHIADIPARTGMVNVENDFAATYELTEKGQSVIADLKKLMSGCSEVILATDADREGELIAAHLMEYLNPRVPVKRVAFHAVTKEGIEEALRNPREIDGNLVEAARARRILDRLFGFEVSDVSRRKVRRDSTAGRVQSPALRLVVEREYERLRFVSATYADVVAHSSTDPSFVSTLKKVNGQSIASGKDFDALGVLTTTAHRLGIEDAQVIASELEQGITTLVVADVTEKSTTRQPQPPFTMSSLYQDALNRLGMSMREAQSASGVLFDKGLITYPRTDNPVHDPASRRVIRAAIAEHFGNEMVAPFERYTSTKKKAQGAHEAIRPTSLNLRKPQGLTERQLAMYQMIWQRTLASQMIEAKGTTRTVTLISRGGTFPLEFTASGTTYHQMGYRSLYGSTSGDESGASFPEISAGEINPVQSAEARTHHTSPPARFTEASLVKELEELGIGRPSTYAPIIAKLRERYVWNKSGDRALIPTVTAFALHRLLTSSFSGLVDYSFTSNLEERLDEVAEDQSHRLALLENFYFGTPQSDGLQSLVTQALDTVRGEDMFAMSFGQHPETGEEIILRPGRMFGTSARPYIECGSVTVSISDQTEFSDLSTEAVLRLLSMSTPRLIGYIEDVPVFVRYAGNGSYLQWGEKGNFPPESKKPRSMSLLSSMDADSVTIADAEQLFSLPRTVGETPEGETITATLGKFGAYISCGNETRSLKDDSRVFSITEDEAIELLKQPKKNRRGAGKGSRRKKGA